MFHLAPAQTQGHRKRDCGPTSAGKEQLSFALKALLSSPFEIDAHNSGVRPVIKGRQPSVRQHKDHPQLWFFNGLASKACLWAPHLSAALSKALNTPNTSTNPFTPAFPSGVESAYDTDRQHRERLTTVAHRIIGEKLREGQVAIDATAGNGNDTLLLVKLVGPEGYVYAFDIQPLAISRTKERVGMTHANLSLINDSHVEIPRHVTPAHHEKIALTTFNLGYLPGGDEAITTQPESSCQAVANALTLLQPGGNCLILCYRGHAGGKEETNRIIALLDELDRDRFRIERHQSENHSNLTPILFRVEKSSTQSSKV